MRSKHYLALAIIAATHAALSQTAVLTPGGASNAVPKFSGSATLVNSAINEVNGQVGIGTANLGAPLNVGGGVYIDADATNNGYGVSPSNFLLFGSPGSGEGMGSSRSGGGAANQYGLDFSTGFQKRFSITRDGNVGVGTLAPAAKLDIEGVSSQVGLNLGGNDSSYVGSDISINRSSSQAGVGRAPALQFNDPNSGSYHIIQGSSAGLQFFNSTPAAGWTERLRIAPSGNVGIGTATPTQLLEVNGNANVDGQLSTAGIVFPDGTSQVTAWTAGAFGSPSNVNIGITGGQAALNVGGPIVIGSSYHGDAALQITSPEGCCGRFTQIGSAGPSQSSLNIMSSTDATGNAQWFSWGVNKGSWSINPGLAFLPSPSFSISSTGNVGIGTAVPGAPLEVNGNIMLTQGGPGKLIFPDGSQLSSANGLVANGISASNGNTTVNGDLHVTGNTNPNLSTQGGYFGWNALTGSTGETDFINQQGGGPGGFAFFNAPPSGTPTTLLMFLNGSNGNLGIGTTSPGAKLEVNGNVKLTTGSGATITFPDNTVQATAWNGILPGGDYAESVDVTGSRAEYEPGDVLVVDPSREGSFAKSSGTYSTAVMGIYSTRPGLVGRRQKSDRSHMAEEVPMAMIGVVPTKVTNEGGPIMPGDLLVTSSKPGYAMKGTDHSQMMGAIIGKALGHLDMGTGLIEVAVSLQ